MVYAPKGDAFSPEQFGPSWNSWETWTAYQKAAQVMTCALTDHHRSFLQAWIPTTALVQAQAPEREVLSGQKPYQLRRRTVSFCYQGLTLKSWSATACYHKYLLQLTFAAVVEAENSPRLFSRTPCVHFLPLTSGLGSVEG